MLLALYGATSGEIGISKIDGAINQAILCIRTEQDKNFIKYQWQKNKTKILDTYLQGGQGNLSSQLVGSLVFGFPNLDEQRKIAIFLNLIDDRIETQNKIISKYESLIKSIMQKIFTNQAVLKTTTKLHNLINIFTGKRNANEAVEGGSFPFFTCGKEILRIDKYSFEGESLLISGNGEIGQIKYFNGKFDAYQRTYVLQNSKIPMLYLKAYLSFILPMVIGKNKQQSAMPYIVLETLKNIDIPIIDDINTNLIIDLFKILDKKAENEKRYSELLLKERAYLMNNMFI
ncbi:type I restriction-modification system specificity subunit [Mycoplasmopsis californica]|nr:type I restriction-modification system specificity subunit [Mycoplasmopsis californica]